MSDALEHAEIIPGAVQSGLINENWRAITDDCIKKLDGIMIQDAFHMTDQYNIVQIPNPDLNETQKSQGN